MIYAIGYVIGLMLFLIGFRFYRQYRLMADTPEAPVRSLPMGLVRIRGKATGDDRLTSPLTGVPCFYYQVKVERLVHVKDDKGGTRDEWQETSTDRGERSFYLADATAKVRVNPANAEYDVMRTCFGEVGTAMTVQLSIGHPVWVEPSLGVPAPSLQDLRNYLGRSASGAAAGLASLGIPGANVVGKAIMAEQAMESMGVSIGGVGGPQRYRLTEICLPADHDCNILGTCAENPSPKDEHDRNVIMKGQNEKTFLISTQTGNKVENSLRST